MRLVTAVGEVYPLKIDRNTIGRAQGNDIVFEDEAIAERHVELRWDGSVCEVIDLQSANGTFVDDRRLAPYQPEPISSSSLLRLGPEFTVSLISDVVEVGKSLAPSDLPIPLSQTRTQRIRSGRLNYRKMGLILLGLLITSGGVIFLTWILTLLFPGTSMLGISIGLIGLALLILFCLRFWKDIKQGFREGWKSVLKN